MLRQGDNLHKAALQTEHYDRAHVAFALRISTNAGGNAGVRI